MTGKTPKNAHLWARHPDDWYVEERFASRELFKREKFPGGVIYDPCCGMGHILHEAMAFGYDVVGTDLKDRGAPGYCGSVDFLANGYALGVSIVMNPPYLGGKGIEAFVRKAMSLPEVVKIAAFVPSKFLWGKERAAAFWIVTPPTVIYAITPRPSCPPGPVIAAGEEPGGGFEDFAWAVWERDLFSKMWPGGGSTSRLDWIVGER